MKLACHECKIEIEFRDRPGWKPPRKFRCLRCVNDRRRKRRAERVRRSRGVRDGMAYPKNRLLTCTEKARCEICDVWYTAKEVVVDGVYKPPVWEHRHHLIPRRFSAMHGQADLLVNILSVCEKCHGTLKRLDNAILKNDWVGAVMIAKVVHVPLDRLAAAAAAYGFDISKLV